MIDHTEVEKIAQRMQLCCRNLHKMAPQVAGAKTVKEFIGDQKKNALASEVAKLLRAGESATAAESQARATPAFQATLEALQTRYEAAMGVLAAYDAEMCSWESSRSLLSWAKESMRTMEG